MYYLFWGIGPCTVVFFETWEGMGRLGFAAGGRVRGREFLMREGGWTGGGCAEALPNSQGNYALCR